MTAVYSSTGAQTAALRGPTSQSNLFYKVKSHKNKSFTFELLLFRLYKHTNCSNLLLYRGPDSSSKGAQPPCLIYLGQESQEWIFLHLKYYTSGHKGVWKYQRQQFTPVRGPRLDKYNIHLQPRGPISYLNKHIQVKSHKFESFCIWTFMCAKYHWQPLFSQGPRQYPQKSHKIRYFKQNQSPHKLNLP